MYVLYLLSYAKVLRTSAPPVEKWRVLPVQQRGCQKRPPLFCWLAILGREWEMVREKKETEQKKPITQEQLQKIEQMAQNIRYGSLTLIFQDGVLIQVDKNEKVRL